MGNDAADLPEADWDLSKVSDDIWRHNTAELLQQVDRTGTTDTIAVTHNGTTTPLIVLHTTGAKTGKTYRTPLIRIEHNGTYAVVASKGGAPTNPAWYHNLTTHRHATIHDGHHTAPTPPAPPPNKNTNSGGTAPPPTGPPTPTTPPKPPDTSPSSSSNPTTPDPATRVAGSRAPSHTARWVCHVLVA
jgi:deazaflavin-dependent oxidoreductase (nitroreductase family)